MKSVKKDNNISRKRRDGMTIIPSDDVEQLKTSEGFGMDEFGFRNNETLHTATATATTPTPTAITCGRDEVSVSQLD